MRIIDLLREALAEGERGEANFPFGAHPFGLQLRALALNIGRALDLSEAQIDDAGGEASQILDECEASGRLAPAEISTAAILYLAAVMVDRFSRDPELARFFPEVS